MLPLDFIKNVVHYNIKTRYIDMPKLIYEYTVYSENYDSIYEHITKIKDFHQFCNSILKPVFSKGINRLFKLIDLMNDSSLWKNRTINYKMFIVAQYIILNQVFGDGNHRTSIYVLNIFSTYSNEEIELIMNFTERIHHWKGDLHNEKLWIHKEKLLYPDTKKLFTDKHISLLLKKI